MFNLDIIQDTMIKAAMSAARHIRRDFSEIENLQISSKSAADFVTMSDVKAEEIIHSILKKSFPDYSILGEENGFDGDESCEHIFVIDPIDGTTNFIHSIPHFAIHISYMNNGETVATVIYDPIKDEMFKAQKGKGAYLNDTRIRVSNRSRMHESLFACGIPFKGINEEKHEEFLKKCLNIMQVSSGLRRFGAATLDLAYVAAGRYEGFFEYGLNIWDICGGLLLIKEAGGFIVDDKRREYKIEGFGHQKKWIIGSNSDIHDDFVNTLLKK